MSDALAVGFYGKLPMLGDFVRRHVSDRTVVAWDAWLQQALAASRDRLGDGWLDLYLTAPMWRFFVQPGVLDEQPVAGVLFPSVDRVGRHFPFTVFARLPRRCVGLVVADRCAAWFERVEDLVLAHFEDDTRDRRCVWTSPSARPPSGSRPHSTRCRRISRQEGSGTLANSATAACTCRSAIVSTSPRRR